MLVPAAGVEPATFRSGGERSNPLSYAGNLGLPEKITQPRKPCHASQDPILGQFGTGRVLLLILRSTNREPRRVGVATGQTLAFRLMLAVGTYKPNCLPIRLSVRPVATQTRRGSVVG